MELIYIILPLALGLAAIALVAFIWAARSGQFDDLETPSRRVLFDDVPVHGEALPPAPVSAESDAPESAEDEPGQP